MYNIYIYIYITLLQSIDSRVKSFTRLPNSLAHADHHRKYAHNSGFAVCCFSLCKSVFPYPLELLYWQLNARLRRQRSDPKEYGKCITPYTPIPLGYDPFPI